jgi:6-pyruvoyltetrahydropterin/6-carboxytetrahydropterin synthase
MWELAKIFWFESAHTLEREVDTEPSRRIHGHSYRAEVTIRGMPDPKTGMIVDLGFFDRTLAEAQAALDHRYLDDIDDLGPPTMENLSAWIWRRMAPVTSGLVKVTIYRDSKSESCSYYGPQPTTG